jgi:hypothetical protein
MGFDGEAACMVREVSSALEVLLGTAERCPRWNQQQA